VRRTAHHKLPPLLLLLLLLLLLQALRATRAHDLERLAEAESRLKDELTVTSGP
jgi:hypothetical protein